MIQPIQVVDRDGAVRGPVLKPAELRAVKARIEHYIREHGAKGRKVNMRALPRPHRTLHYIRAVKALYVLLLAAPAWGADAKKPAAPEDKARAIVAALAKKDFAAASKDFGDAVKKALPEEKLAGVWQAIQGQAGAFRKVLGTRTEKAAGHRIVFVTCEFAKGKLDLRLAFDKDGKVVGFRVDPTYEFKPPPYAKPASFTEVAVVVGAGGDWPLPGTLALPKGDGPFPAVVLLHGSGPHDRDETIGPNKPLRDLAWGLATQGVAVLRFEKRNKAHLAKVLKVEDSFTIKEEAVDDALAAVKLLRKRKGIDGKRIFVAGHSLGGFVAPLVGSRDAKLGGLVLLAANSRPLEDLVLEQFPYLLSLKGKLSAEDKKVLADLKKKVARVKDAKLSPDTPAKDLPLGLRARYWLALKAYDPPATAAKLKMPLLILQGERDYQVTLAGDFAGWKKALGKRKNVTLKSYPSLNHLFMEGKGKSRPEEYLKPGHVAKEVVNDIAEWVKKR
jgi:dienelactone hydrolase